MTRLRLGLLAAFGVLAGLQWGALVTDPPLPRLIGVVVVATALGAALRAIGPAAGPRRGAADRLLLVGVVVVATAAGALVVGIPARAIVPWGWDRLAAGVETGLNGLGGSFDYPYDGPGAWSRLLLVVPFVPLMIAAAALAFGRGRDRGRVPVAGLVALLAAFAVPAVARPTPAPLLWGGLLLLLVAAWLWGDRARTLPALVAVAGFGAVAVPVAAGLAADDPPLDYRSWALPGIERVATFDWEPSYGPIDWPRTGALLFRVHADRPSYWRVEVLDEFYADGWRRSGTGGGPVPAEPAPAPGPLLDPGRTRSAWFSIRALESPLLISPGTPLAFEGVDGSDRDRDGTTHVEEQPLEAGDSYSVVAWAPDPRPGRLRAASRRYRAPLEPYTRLALPDAASLEAINAPAHIEVPLWGHRRGVERARRRLARSAYSGVAEMAERLSAGADSGYEAAVAISSHLRGSYDYDERPPVRRLPLRSFLFGDGIGYCQHFSGAMALMLRMIGVPARVAAGFAPGTPLANDRGFEVTDLEAHSWVEVYFNGIGWLPFDPTPPTAPATIEVRGGASFGPGAADPRVGDDGARTEGRGHDASAPAGSDGDGGSLPLPPLGVLAALAGAVLVVPPIRSLRHRRLPAEAASGRELAELRRALRATGWARRESTTLLAVEGRLRGARRSAAAAYVQRFRERLYGTADVPAPSLAERRSLRRDLGSGSGLRSRLRLLALIPPGAPARRARG
jgi:transglutaminase-like putative cysteine protease